MHARSAVVRPALALALALVAGATAARADDRRFTYVDEVRVAALHGFEFEQWITWEHTNNSDEKDINTFAFKEELEYGLDEKTQIGFEIPSWHFTTGPDDEKDGPRLDALAADIKHIFLDPVSDPVGLALKAEFGISEEHIEIAGEVILQKNIDKWEFAYEFLLEAGWSNDENGKRYREDEGEISNRLGVSYELTNKFFVGAELLHEIPMPDWKTGVENQVLWIGPNASYHETNWAITLAVLPRLTDSDEEPNFQIRTIFEIDF